MKDEKGFSLVEVLFASSILTTVIVAVTALFVLSMKTNAAAGDQTSCVTLAQERIEKLKHQDYEGITVGGSVDTCSTGFCDKVDVDGSGKPRFQVAWAVGNAGTISSSLTTGTLRLMTLDVKCTSLRAKNGQPGTPKTVLLSTFRTPNATE